MSTRNGRSWSALSSSGDGEDHMLASKAQWGNETELLKKAKNSTVKVRSSAVRGCR